MENKIGPWAEMWRFFLWRGFLFGLIGLIAFLWPTPTTWALALTLAGLMIIDGIFLITFYIKVKSIWGFLPFCYGVICIALGLYALFFPSITALALVLALAVKSFVGGIFEIRMSFILRKILADEGLLMINGTFCILFAILLTTTITVIPWIQIPILMQAIGMFGIIIAIVMFALSYNLKKLCRKS